MGGVNGFDRCFLIAAAVTTMTRVEVDVVTQVGQRWSRRYGG